MTLLLLALLVAFAGATALVLADSGLRLWSAFAGIRAQHGALLGGQREAVRRRARITTRISYARPAGSTGRTRPAPLGAAA